jgi:ubiquinone/menaquinone biosynthesis C-methylase UbiE
MSFDKLVHSKPEFYAKKLDVTHSLKRLLYRVLLIDSHVTKQRKEIALRNEALMAKYLMGKTILEVGCGRGYNLASLYKDWGCQCFGVDTSPQMIEYAQSHNPGPTYCVTNGPDLPFEQDQFDFVIFNYVLHHAEKLDQMIREAKRVGKHVIIYEACAFDHQPWKALSVLYWRTVDGGFTYKSLNEWKSQFGWSAIAEIEGSGLVRYGMCVFQKPLLNSNALSAAH